VNVYPPCSQGLDTIFFFQVNWGFFNSHAYSLLENLKQTIIKSLMNLNVKILKRFFEGKYSRNDYYTIRSYFTDIKKRQELKEDLQDHWFEFNDESLPEGNIDHVLQKIHNQIVLETIPDRRRKFITRFQRIAAILIVPLLLSFFAVLYFQPPNIGSELAIAEIQCPLGVRTKFVLPDGTTGFLNSGSTLEYPVVFNKHREVILKGEAYFDVKPDKERPFTVVTPYLATKVLGTEFNMIAYENENREEIILKEGSVEVYSRRGEKLETLKSDQKLDLCIETHQYKTIDVEASQYVSWTEGKLVFRNEGMQQVADRLGRWYNVEFEIQDLELMQYSFRATFIDEPMEEVLKLLALTAPISYEEQIREITEENVYKKRKVILSIDKKRLDAF